MIFGLLGERRLAECGHRSPAVFRPARVCASFAELTLIRPRMSENTVLAASTTLEWARLYAKAYAEGYVHWSRGESRQFHVAEFRNEYVWMHHGCLLHAHIDLKGRATAPNSLTASYISRIQACPESIDGPRSLVHWTTAAATFEVDWRGSNQVQGVSPVGACHSPGHYGNLPRWYLQC